MQEEGEVLDVTGVARPMSNLLSRAGHPALAPGGKPSCFPRQLIGPGRQGSYRLVTFWTTLNLHVSPEGVSSKPVRRLSGGHRPPLCPGAWREVPTRQGTVAHTFRER